MVIPAQAGTHHSVIPAQAGTHHSVIPAQAGTQYVARVSWVPACAGMTRGAAKKSSTAARRRSWTKSQY
jgi:hypothetical protein